MFKFYFFTLIISSTLLYGTPTDILKLELKFNKEEAVTLNKIYNI